MKECKYCHKQKPLTDFNKYATNSDGLMTKCKACVGLYNREYLKNNRDKLLEYKHRYNASDKGKQLLAEMKRKHRLHKLANTKLYQAVKSGEIKKPKICETCKREVLLNGHHDDYDKPLVVKWLCVACHHKLHRLS